MRNVKHIIFDFDDTLVHTFEMSYALHTKIAGEMGAFIPTRDEFKAASHMPWERIIEHFWPGKHEHFRRAFIPNNQLRTSVTPELVEGVQETLERLQRSYGLHLLTHRDGTSLSQALKMLGLQGFFSSVHPLESLANYKPHPGVFDNVLNQLGRECLYVGDGVADFQAAHGAGIGFAGVLTGATSADDFIAAGLKSERIIKSVKYLPSLFRMRPEVKNG